MEATKNIVIPIKYKFLAVLLLITASGIGVFFYFTSNIFSEDKRLFIMDYNLVLLRAATSEIKLELRTRLEELQAVIPRIYQPVDEKKITPFEGITANLSTELLRMRFFRKTPEGKFDLVRDFINTPVTEGKKLRVTDLEELDRAHPLSLNSAFENVSFLLLNRSIRIILEKQNIDLPVITFLLPGSFVDSDSRELIIVVDVLQDFLRKKLHQSEVAQIFLINRNGTIVSHAQLTPTIQYAKVKFSHPIVDRLKTKTFSRESFELMIDDEPYLCNLTETGFPDILAVSQIRKKDAFLALKVLMEKSLLIGALVLCVATVITVLFAARLTANIQKLQIAAEKIGSGNLRVKLNIRSNDEIQSVARSFEWMIRRLEELISESAQKARMEEELETARVVQSTILATPQFQSQDFDVAAHYVPATECGGDIWDLHIDGKTVTLLIADATGHGAPAAIVTAVAKSCFSTLNSIYKGQSLTPDQYLTLLNQIIYSACKGKLLMTMCVVQLDLETGKLLISNAGHESPLCLRSKGHSSSSMDDKGKKAGAEVLFVRGERLGYDPEITYESVPFQMSTKDTLLLYSDGVTEAKSADGKDWGERNLKKIFSHNGVRPLDIIKGELVEAVNTHIQGTNQEDDITFVLLSLRAQVTPQKTVTEENSGDNYGNPEAA